MSRIPVLVLVDPDDPVAAIFRDEIERDVQISTRVDLRFASVDDAFQIISEIEIVACGVLPAHLITLADHLKWIAYWSAGLDGKITQQIRERKLLLTNASGVHGPNIAEHVMAMMLMFTRRMEVHMRSQINQVWERRMPVERPPAAELNGQTLGIIGLGRIGEALVVRARAFGMNVVAVKRDPTVRYRSEADAAPDRLSGMEGLPALLSESDHVCVALPHTPQTHHLIDGNKLALMKPTAYLYNIARGAIIDEGALTAALSEGRIAGAGLDVFEEEPLPQSSPLWNMQNVIITPHVSGLTPHYFDRFAKLFAGNLRRYLACESLNNLYVSERGY